MPTRAAASGICGQMSSRFNIGHVTIQVESGGVATCHLAGADAV